MIRNQSDVRIINMEWKKMNREYIKNLGLSEMGENIMIDMLAEKQGKSIAELDDNLIIWMKRATHHQKLLLRAIEFLEGMPTTMEKLVLLQILTSKESENEIE